MFCQANKFKFKLINIFLIFSSLIITSSANKNPRRFLQFVNNLEPHATDFNNTNYNNTLNETEKEKDIIDIISEDPGSYLLGWFIIFFFMGLYIACSMKNYPEIRNRADDVYKFMFFANNGILVAASVNVFDIKNLIIDSSPFASSALVFIIGCIYYISKYCQTCSIKFAAKYFSCDYLGELYKLPCFIWSLKFLANDCLRSNTITVIYYTDGSSESDACCHYIWNCFIFIIKILAVIFSIVSFYIFLLFYLIFWLIAKCIFLLVLECKGVKVPIEQEPKPEQPVDINVNRDPNDIGSIDELHPREQVNPNHIRVENINNITNYIINNCPTNINNGNINNINNNGTNNPNFGNTQNEINVNQQQGIRHEIQNSDNIKSTKANQNNQNNYNNNNFTSPNLDLPGKEEVEQSGQIPKPSPDGETEKDIKMENLNEENKGENNNMGDAPVPGLSIKSI